MVVEKATQSPVQLKKNYGQDEEVKPRLNYDLNVKQKPAFITLENPQCQYILDEQSRHINVERQSPYINIGRAADVIQVNEEPVQINCQPSAAEVLVENGQPIVEVEQKAPEIEIEQFMPKLYLKMPPIKVYLEMDGAPEILMDPVPPSVKVKQSDPLVRFTNTNPKVMLNQAPPKLLVSQLPSQVEVIPSAKASIQVKENQPIVSFTEGAPTLRALECGQPKISYSQPDPELSYTECGPRVYISQKDASVSLKHEAPTVSVTPREPTVSINHRAPKIDVQRHPVAVSVVEPATTVHFGKPGSKLESEWVQLKTTETTLAKQIQQTNITGTTYAQWCNSLLSCDSFNAQQGARNSFVVFGGGEAKLLEAFKTDKGNHTFNLNLRNSAGELLFKCESEGKLLRMWDSSNVQFGWIDCTATHVDVFNASGAKVFSLIPSANSWKFDIQDLSLVKLGYLQREGKLSGYDLKFPREWKSDNKMLLLGSLFLIDIEELVNDIDLICLLFTCKQFYYNFRQQYKCRFKGVSLIDKSSDTYKIRYNTLYAIQSFHLGSFTDIFHRSISNQLVKSCNIPLFNYDNNNNNNSRSRDDSIEKSVILVDDIDDNLLVDDLPDTIKWLSIDSSGRPLTLEDGWKLPSELESLEYMSYNSGMVGLGVLPETLTELTLDVPPHGLADGVIPQSVQTLVLKNNDVFGAPDIVRSEYHLPHRLSHLYIYFAIDTLSLQFPPTLKSLTWWTPPLTPDYMFPTSLVYLKLVIHDTLNYPLNLSLLTSLQTLKINARIYFVNEPTPSDYLRLPPNLTSLTLHAKATIESLTFFPKSLVSLDTNYNIVSGAIDKGEQLPDTLTYLCLRYCHGTIPAGFIGPTLKSLKLTFSIVHAVLLEGSIPEGVQTLSVNNYQHNGIVQLIPKSVNHFSWSEKTSVKEYLAFPSTIRTLEYKPKEIDPATAHYQIPSSLTSLTTIATRCCPTTTSSVGEYQLSTFYQCNEDENNRKWILPKTVTFLSLEIPPQSVISHFRFDPIIYQTNVTELVLQSDSRDIIHCNIQRFEELDIINNNNNSDTYDVLITDKHSLLGGVVRLGKQQQKLYLNWKGGVGANGPPTISTTIPTV
ncbi:hypothetical protein DFA_03158 [Cavenderia fasciculata]|uniref:Uncharacterized protein n=1 Tax=Cavenderia fasciculata TaxID=261658 RepID=F4PGS9_CACFS|nr:uncharacterized protein DFA_03158 [Cavenderia fasciculata]EGG24913.1 hypothetical protein DFA_03158 [Cavenderia fasciculata]|eukprot:XP_004362764.1 hypothetical protein DFA_03158 [Cavenderia fasciculata]